MCLKLHLLLFLLTVLKTNSAQSIGNGITTGDLVTNNVDASSLLMNSNQILNANVPTINNIENQGLNNGLLSFQNLPEPIAENNANDLNRSTRGSFLSGFGSQSPILSSLTNNLGPAGQIGNNLSGFKSFANGFGTGTALSGITNTLNNGLTNRGAVDDMTRSVRTAGIDNLINQAGMVGNPFSGGTFTNTLPNPSFTANSPLSAPANPNILLNNPGFSGPSADFHNHNGGLLNNNLINTANAISSPIPNSLSVGNGLTGTIPSLGTLDLANHKKTLATLTGINPSNLGSVSKLAVTSSMPLSPTGLSVLAENLMMDGSVSVAGKLPFVGTVNVEGTIPDNGIGTVFYECGNSNNIGMVSDDRALIGQNNFNAGRQLNNGVGTNLGFNNRGFTRNI